MLSVADALARVLREFSHLEPETVSIEAVAGRVLAQPVSATLDLPPFPNSSMDGYAVRAADVRSAGKDNPVTLAVVGDIPAGTKPEVRVGPGAAARIMTGAHMPEGADSVIPVEDTGADRHAMDGPLPARVQIFRSVDPGAYLRRAAEDVRTGDVVFAAGHVVRPYDVGLLAAFGLQTVPVVRRPRVAVLGTGDEVVSIDQSPRLGQIRDSNTFNLAALVRQYGGDPIRLGVAPDRVEAVTDYLQSAVDMKTDLIVSSAGVSVGAYDVVKAAVERGGLLDFWKVRMRPGKPVAFGRYRGIPFFGLPGNPVSAVVSFELFVRPALLRLAGHTRLQKPVIVAELTDTVQSDGRESYLRAVVVKDGQGYIVRSAGGQGSNILSALSQANALMIVPEGVLEMRAGSHVQVWMLDWPEVVF